MIKDHSRRRMTESKLLINNRAMKPYAVIAGIQTYVDYLHENLCFFPPEGRLNFALGDVAGLTQVCNNYATMLQIPQVTPVPPTPPSPYDADATAWFEAVRLANIAAGASASSAEISTPNKAVMNDFFITLKNLNVWTAIQQSNFLGASPYLAGALVPLKPSFGTVTNNNFVEADYSRTSGLTTNGGKYINTGFIPTISNQNNFHALACYPNITFSSSKGLFSNSGSYNATSLTAGFWANSLATGIQKCFSSNTSLNTSA